MVFPNIEKIKQEYTDKYVVVDPQRPELARFADVVGQVKTVNMSGRALVEFADYHLNIGWYDIELEFLKVVDKPLPKPKEEKKPAPKAEAKPAEAKAASTPPAKEGSPGKPSTADILAKLKGGAGAAPTAAPAEKKEAAPKAEAPAPAGKAADRSKMSVADMIAAAKGGAAAAAPAAKTEPAPVKEEAPAPSPAAAAAPAPKSEGGIVKIDKSGMSIDAMVAYCREKDAS